MRGDGLIREALRFGGDRSCGDGGDGGRWRDDGVRGQGRLAHQSCALLEDGLRLVAPGPPSLARVAALA